MRTTATSHRRHVVLESRVDAGGCGRRNGIHQHDRNGLIVPADPRAMALAISRVWNDRAEAQRLGAAARQRVDGIDLSWEKSWRTCCAYEYKLVSPLTPRPARSRVTVSSYCHSCSRWPGWPR